MEKVVQGVSGDFGLGLRFLGPEDFRVAYVQPNSPAGQAELERGFRILELNGIRVNTENIQQLNHEFQSTNDLNLELQKNDNSHLSITRLS